MTNSQTDELLAYVRFQRAKTLILDMIGAHGHFNPADIEDHPGLLPGFYDLPGGFDVDIEEDDDRPHLCIQHEGFGFTIRFSYEDETDWRLFFIDHNHEDVPSLVPLNAGGELDDDELARMATEALGLDLLEFEREQILRERAESPNPIAQAFINDLVTRNLICPDAKAASSGTLLSQGEHLRSMFRTAAGDIVELNYWQRYARPCYSLWVSQEGRDYPHVAITLETTGPVSGRLETGGGFHRVGPDDLPRRMADCLDALHKLTAPPAPYRIGHDPAP